MTNEDLANEIEAAPASGQKPACNCVGCLCDRNRTAIISALRENARMREALAELAAAAEHDLVMNRDEGDDTGGGWWSLRTANAIDAAHAALRHLDTPNMSNTP